MVELTAGEQEARLPGSTAREARVQPQRAAAVIGALAVDRELDGRLRCPLASRFGVEMFPLERQGGDQEDGG